MGHDLVRRDKGRGGRGVTDFCDFVFVGEEDGDDGGAAEEVFDFEGVDVGVLGRFVVIEHEVEGVGLGGEEEELENGVVEGSGGEGPEDVEVAGYVDYHVKSLGFEGDAGAALDRLVLAEL